MKLLKSFALSVILSTLTLSVDAQPGITKVAVLSDAVQDAMYQPILSNAPAIVHIPIVDYTGKTIPVVEVKISGQPYRFIFDTGCSSSVFNTNFIIQSPDDSLVFLGSAAGANSRIHPVSVVKSNDFELGEIKVDELMMMSVAFTDPGKPTYGVIGLNLVRDYDLLFDWPNKEILLINPDSTDIILDKHYKIMESIPLLYYTDPYHICADCQVNGKRIRLLIDTGAYRTLLPDDVSNNDNHHVNKKLLKPKKGRGYQIQYKEYTKDRVTLTLGNHKYRRVKVILGEKVRSEQYEFGGMLGNNVLQRQPILISMKSEKLLLLKHRR